MSNTSGNSGNNAAGYLAAFGGVVLITIVLAPFREHINVTTVALTLLLVVLLIATLCGSRPALLASLLGVFCFNFFFLPPLYTLTIADPQNWIALFAFLAVAVTVGQLSATVKRRAEEAERLYRELQGAFEKASRAEAFRQGEKLKSALLDAVTHDLKTPLTSIKASVTMLIEEQEQDSIHVTLEREGRGDLLDVINEETDRLNTFVESMVEMARLEAGEMTWRKKQTTVEEIISNSLQRAESFTATHKIIVNAEEDLPPLSVDSKAISEVVYNLLDNAVKYSPAASTIEISVRRNDEKILFSVEDEGPGIIAENREKVFQKFYRATRNAKGFGMGLAIVRAIIEAHNGKIWVESGKIGSRFVFDLPLKINERN
jgi:two-component system sensor histidine kinase KdpD